MRLFAEKFRLLGWITLVLTSGFVTTGALGYKVARDAIQQAFTVSAVPAAAEFIHGEIQQELARLISTSSLIASDAFVRNWFLGGERDSERLSRYLLDVDRKYGTHGSFLMSERSRHQYQGNGTLKTVSSADPLNNWLTHAREMKSSYELTVDSNSAESDSTLFSASHRIVDEQGNFIGAARVGLSLNRLNQLIENYRSRLGCRVYFVDSAGIIMLGNGAMQHVRDLPGLRLVSNDILKSSVKPTQRSYREGQSTVYVTTRFIPELRWSLVVAQSDRGIQSVQLALLFNLAVGALATVLVLISVVATVSAYRKRLDSVAAVDTLTGLINRPAYEFIFKQALLETARSEEPLSLILLEVDKFDRVVDLLGRNIGDQVLQNVAELARRSVRESDPVSRWRGDQFLMQLRDCALENAVEVAERLRASVASHDFGVDDPRVIITVSLGVAQHELQEPGNGFLDRTYEALTLARQRGGDRVEPEISGSDE
jgi:diguanylate cyclase (GGDEF)-like protein